MKTIKTSLLFYVVVLSLGLAVPARADDEELRAQFFDAVMAGDHKKAESIFAQAKVPAALQINDNKGYFLQVATETRNYAMMEALIRMGANPNLGSSRTINQPVRPGEKKLDVFRPYSSEFPLVKAVRVSDIRAMNILLKAGAVPSQGLIAALNGKQYSVVQPLIEHIENLEFLEAYVAPETVDDPDVLAALIKKGYAKGFERKRLFEAFRNAVMSGDLTYVRTHLREYLEMHPERTTWGLNADYVSGYASGNPELVQFLWDQGWPKPIPTDSVLQAMIFTAASRFHSPEFVQFAIENGIIDASNVQGVRAGIQQRIDYQQRRSGLPKKEVAQYRESLDTLSRHYCDIATEGFLGRLKRALTWKKP